MNQEPYSTDQFKEIAESDQVALYDNALLDENPKPAIAILAASNSSDTADSSYEKAVSDPASPVSNPETESAVGLDSESARLSNLNDTVKPDCNDIADDNEESLLNKVQSKSLIDKKLALRILFLKG